ncbi:MAG: transcription elongation factor GreA, partial [Gammaproteobacteria bacterium]|nr:transcription elongation factor GreA [Gammaproteobacteria bacterium]
ARALIGKEEGEEAVVDAPSGTMEYVITGVQYK